MVLLVASKGQSDNADNIFHVRGHTPVSIIMIDLGFCSNVDLTPQASTINPRA